MTLFDVGQSAALGLATQAFTRVPTETALEWDFPAAALSRIGEHESWPNEVHRPATTTHVVLEAARQRVRKILAQPSPKTKPQLWRLTPAVRWTAQRFRPVAGSARRSSFAARRANVVGWDINPVVTPSNGRRPTVGHLAEHAYKLVEGHCRIEIDWRTGRARRNRPVLLNAAAACPVCRTETRLVSTHVFSQNACLKRVPEAQTSAPPALTCYRDVGLQRDDLPVATGCSGWGPSHGAT